MTLGVYWAIWWHRINRELHDLGRARDARGLGDDPVLSLFAFGLGWVALGIPYVWTVASTTRRVQRSQRLVGAEPLDGRVAALVWIFTLTLAGPFYTQRQLNKTWAEVTVQPEPIAAPAPASTPPPLTPAPPVLATRRRDLGLRIAGALAIVLAAGAIAVFVFAFDDRVPTYGPSMQPTLSGHASVEIDWDAYESHPPEIGDVVVLQAPKLISILGCGAPEWANAPCNPDADFGEEWFVKRIVGGPGDAVQFTARGTLIRNGTPVPETYINPCSGGCQMPAAETVGADEYFVAGDNRPNSTDSRFFGAIPAESIDGRVLIPQEEPN